MQCVVFDMDGVLFDSERWYCACWEQTAQAHHIPDSKVCRSCLAQRGIRPSVSGKYGADFPYDTYKRRCPHGTGSSRDGQTGTETRVREILEFWRTATSRSIASSTGVPRPEQISSLAGRTFLQDHRRRYGAAEQAHPEIYQTACGAMDVPPADLCRGGLYNGIRAASVPACTP
ncbi:MAG: hypothetical protein ACLUOF_12115 [Ruminococcus sp.]